MKKDMFELKEWIKLPFVMIIRLPFFVLIIVFAFLASTFKKIEDFFWDLLYKLPTLEYSKVYTERLREEARQKIIERYTGNKNK